MTIIVKWNKDHGKGAGNVFTELDPTKDVRNFNRVLNRQVFYPGDTIVEQDSTANRAFYIESGRVEVSVRDDVHSIVLSHLGAGEIFGEMALIEQDKRSATVKAIEETVVSEITHDELESRIEKTEDKAIRAMIYLFAHRLREANRAQMQHYKNLAEFQDRMAGLMKKASSMKMDRRKRDEFKNEIEPLIAGLEKALERYRK